VYILIIISGIVYASFNEKLLTKEVNLMPFRLVYTEFWEDPKVMEEMTPEDKYFYLYLLTNPNTNMIGVYRITKKQMAFDLGYSSESINSILDRFINFHKLIIYNDKTREICIKNYGKYNLNRGGKPMLDCILKDLSKVSDISLVQEIVKNMKHEGNRVFIENYLSPIADDTSNDTCNDTSTKGGQNHKPESINHNPKTKNQKPNTNTSSLLSKKIKSNTDVFKFLEKCNITMSPITMEKVAADIEIYSAIEVAKAAEIADSNGKRSYAYLKGILEKRRAEGTDTKSMEEKSHGANNDNRGEELRNQGIGL